MTDTKDYNYELLDALDPGHFYDNRYYDFKVLKKCADNFGGLPGTHHKNSQEDIWYMEAKAGTALGQLYYWGIAAERNEQLAVKYFEKSKWRSDEAYFYYGLIQLKNGEKDGIDTLCSILWDHGGFIPLEYDYERKTLSKSRTTVSAAGEALYILRTWLEKKNDQASLAVFDEKIRSMWDQGLSEDAGRKAAAHNQYLRGIIVLYSLCPGIDARERIEKTGEVSNRTQLFAEYRKNATQMGYMFASNPQVIDEMIGDADLNAASEYAKTLPFAEGFCIDLMERYKSVWGRMNEPLPESAVKKRKEERNEKRNENLLAFLLVAVPGLLLTALLHYKFDVEWIWSLILGIGIVLFVITRFDI